MNFRELLAMKILSFNKGKTMKILILTSGGDAPGMNKFVAQIYKAFKEKTFFAYAGFTGLVNGQIYPLKDVFCRSCENQAGSIVHSSRCPEFSQDEVFAQGLENAKEFDCVIIMGGNGSEKGAKRLYENGVNTIFVPATIDNDVDENFYTIGFSTAVKECVYTIENSMPSIESFCQACLFEIMGRECDSIAKKTAQIVNADYVVNNKKALDYEKIKNIVLQNYIKNKSTCIVVRENISPVEKMAKKLNEMLGQDMVKFQVVGRTQRGGKPTKQELDMAKRFAAETIDCVKSRVFGVRILADDKNNIVVKEFA